MPIVSIKRMSIPLVTDSPAAVTPTATFAPTARIAHVGAIPGALPQAVNFCAYSARCLRSYPPTAKIATDTLSHSN